MDNYFNVPKDTLTQEEKLLDALKTRDLSVREIFTRLYINSPTKIISNLRKNHTIEEVGEKNYSVYHLVKA